MYANNIIQMPYFKCTTNTVHQHHQNPHTSESSQKSDKMTRSPQHKADTPPLQATASLYYTNHIHPSLLPPLPNIILQGFSLASNAYDPVWPNCAKNNEQTPP